MSKFDEIIKSLVNESLTERANEITDTINKKIESNEDVDKYDLEVGNDYVFDDDEEDYTFMRRGKHSSHGPFHFKRNKKGGEVAFGEKQISNMKKRIKEDQDTDLALALDSKDARSETTERLHGGQKKLDVAEPKGKLTKADFLKLQKMEEEVEEGNAFTGALAKAKKEGKKSFEVDGKEYEVTEDLGGMGLGMGHDDFEDINLSDDENPRVQSLKKKYMRNYPEEVDQEVDFVSGDDKDSINYRIKMGDGDFLDLKESELIEMIEELVLEEKTKDNLKKTGKSAGMVQYDRVSKKEKNENSKANKDSFKKMAEDVKDGSKGKFESNPVMFPKGNGEISKMSKKAYIPSEYVDEYVDAFAYPGQTNLVFDEIKPNDEWIEMNLKGSSKTGNAQVDADGNPLGNVVPTETGDKFYKNYEENLYGATSSVNKAEKILNNLGESKESETSKLLNEEMENMKKLIGYQYKK